MGTAAGASGLSIIYKATMRALEPDRQMFARVSTLDTFRLPFGKPPFTEDLEGESSGRNCHSLSLVATFSLAVLEPSGTVCNGVLLKLHRTLLVF